MVSRSRAAVRPPLWLQRCPAARVARWRRKATRPRRRAAPARTPCLEASPTTCGSPRSAAGSRRRWSIPGWRAAGRSRARARWSSRSRPMAALPTSRWCAVGQCAARRRGAARGPRRGAAAAGARAAPHSGALPARCGAGRGRAGRRRGPGGGRGGRGVLDRAAYRAVGSRHLEGPEEGMNPQQFSADALMQSVFRDHYALDAEKLESLYTSRSGTSGTPSSTSRGTSTSPSPTCSIARATSCRGCAAWRRCRRTCSSACSARPRPSRSPRSCTASRRR